MLAEDAADASADLADGGQRADGVEDGGHELVVVAGSSLDAGDGGAGGGPVAPSAERAFTRSICSRSRSGSTRRMGRGSSLIAVYR